MNVKLVNNCKTLFNGINYYVINNSKRNKYFDLKKDIPRKTAVKKYCRSGVLPYCTAL